MSPSAPAEHVQTVVGFLLFSLTAADSPSQEERAKAEKGMMDNT